MLERFNLAVALLLLMVGAYMLALTRGASLRVVRACGYAVRSGRDGARALFTALAGSIGTGNVAGVAAALAIGGAGSVFWMWVSGALGMATKLCEVYIAVRFKERREDGAHYGGAMYVMERMGGAWRGMAKAFALFTLTASLGVGNIVQINTIVSAGTEALCAAGVCAAGVRDAAWLPWAFGVPLAAALFVVMRGGARRAGEVAARLVPAMSVAYMAVAIAVVIVNIDSLPRAFAEIFAGAFDPKPVLGGVAGFGIARTIRTGACRGIFSNEAGMGSSPMAYAAADYNDPVAAGMAGVVEVFVDTIVICTLTALMVLTSGIRIPYGAADVSGMALALDSVSTIMSRELAGMFLAVSVTLFAFTSMVGWSFYGTRAAFYLFGKSGELVYAFAYAGCTIAGALLGVDAAWLFGETANALMALPNIAMLISMRKTISCGICENLCYNTSKHSK